MRPSVYNMAGCITKLWIVRRGEKEELGDIGMALNGDEKHQREKEML